MNYSPSDSSIHGILRARILEWIVIPFSRGSSCPRDWTQASCNAGTSLTIWSLALKSSNSRPIPLPPRESGRHLFSIDVWNGPQLLSRVDAGSSNLFSTLWPVWSFELQIQPWDSLFNIPQWLLFASRIISNLAEGTDMVLLHVVPPAPSTPPLLVAMVLSTSSCTYWLFVCLPLWNICSSHLLILKTSCLYSYHWLK